MRKFLGELKLIKDLCDTDKIADILRDKSYVVMFSEETATTKVYNILDNEEINPDYVYTTESEDNE